MPLDPWRTGGFNSKLDGVVRVVAYWILHNYCIDWGALKLGPPNVKPLLHNLQGFGDRLPTIK